MTAEEAVRQAEAEGLTLLKAESNTTGYKGVLINNGRVKHGIRVYFSKAWLVRHTLPGAVGGG